MRLREGLRAAVAATMLTGVPLPADAQTPSAMKSAKEAPAVPGRKFEHMRTWGDAVPPFGFVEACRRISDLCVRQNLAAKNVDRHTATDFTFLQVREMYAHIHAIVIQKIDREQAHGKEEQWDEAITEGDCEDFALRYRRELLALGWAPHNLLMAVVTTERGEGHAILKLRTTQSDFFIDVRRPGIHTPEDLRAFGYKFISRQSPLNPNIWVALAPEYAAKK
jgi:predicted transglutaminase-like cysteine proteinase